MPTTTRIVCPSMSIRDFEAARGWLAAFYGDGRVISDEAVDAGIFACYPEGWPQFYSDLSTGTGDTGQLADPVFCAGWRRIYG
jgi:hypothetical protein